VETIFADTGRTPARRSGKRRGFCRCRMALRLVADRTVCAVVDALAQVLARLEVRNVLARERHRLPRLGIASLTGRAEVEREAAEATDLDAITLRQRVAHDLEDLLQRQLHVTRRQVLLLGGDDLDQFRLRHGIDLSLSPGRRSAPSAG